VSPLSKPGMVPAETYTRTPDAYIYACTIWRQYLGRCASSLHTCRFTSTRLFFSSFSRWVLFAN